MSLGREIAARPYLWRRNRAAMTEAVADSGDKIRRPGGEFARGRRMESEREAWGSYRRGQASY
jgi:hypothetical protein